MTLRRSLPEQHAVQPPVPRRTASSASTPSRAAIPLRASRHTQAMALRHAAAVDDDETETEIAPYAQSVGTWSGLHPEDQPYSTTASFVEDEEDEAAMFPTRSPTSVRRYHPISPLSPSRSVSMPTSEPTRVSRPREGLSAAPIPRRRMHWLTTLGLGMTLVVFVWLAISLAIGWVEARLDDLHYGLPRTYQTDAVVGHHDSVAHPSHFLAQNLHGHIQVIEQEGNDPTKAHLYAVATLPEQDETPVTLSFVSMGGKECMVVHFGSLAVLYVNTGTSFQAQGAAHS